MGNNFFYLLYVHMPLISSTPHAMNTRGGIVTTSFIRTYYVVSYTQGHIRHLFKSLLMGLYELSSSYTFRTFL
jgi:hypothetical protein